MKLLEAIIDANHRALSGDNKAGLHLGDYTDELPLIALTCIDPRLNKLFPGALALSDQNFIWLRNAGNIIFGPMSTMMRSLALACAVKGGKEIAIIGHSDCQVRHTTEATLVQRFQDLGIGRQQLPEDLKEFFGTFNDERDNVFKSVNFVRNSPLIGARVPVHGLMVDTPTGRLEWVVNGYDALARVGGLAAAMQMPELGSTLQDLSKMGNFNLGEIKFPEQKIGDVSAAIGTPASAAPRDEAPVTPPMAKPPPIRVPPAIPQKAHTSWRAKP
jgi:carbonic anhydrase